MSTIKTILKAIEIQKQKILELSADNSKPYAEKQETLALMRQTLIRTQAAACVIMQEELDESEGEAA